MLAGELDNGEMKMVDHITAEYATMRHNVETSSRAWRSGMYYAHLRAKKRMFVVYRLLRKIVRTLVLDELQVEEKDQETALFEVLPAFQSAGAAAGLQTPKQGSVGNEMKDQQAALFEVLPTFEGAANAVEDARKVAAEAAVGDSVGGGSKGPFIFVASDTSKTRTRRSMDEAYSHYLNIPGFEQLNTAGGTETELTTSWYVTLLVSASQSPYRLHSSRWWSQRCAHSFSPALPTPCL